MKKIHLMLGGVTLLCFSGCQKPVFEETILDVCEPPVQTYHAAVGDFTGDGVLDLAVAHGEGVRLFVRDDSGKLLPGPDKRFSEPVFNLAVWPSETDERDALLLALGGSHSREIIRLNLTETGDAFTTGEVILTTGGELDRMVVCDVDEDEIPDLIMPGLDVWIRNAGSQAEPELSQTTLLDPGTEWRKVYGTWGDFNSDGIPDAAYVFTRDGTVRIYEGGASGYQSIHLGEDVWPLGVFGGGDFNEDGQLDLVVDTGSGLPGESEVRLALSEGEGQWRLMEVLEEIQDPEVIVAADFNGNGWLDLVAAPMAQPGVETYALTYLPGEGDGRFGKAQLVPVTGFPYRLMPGKINGNGPADLVYLEMDSGKAVLLDFK